MKAKPRALDTRPDTRERITRFPQQTDKLCAKPFIPAFVNEAEDMAIASIPSNTCASGDRYAMLCKRHLAPTFF